MKNLEIIINGKTVQLTDQIRPVIEKVVSEFRNPLKKTGSYSYTIKFPVTQTNKVIFDFQNEVQVIGKFRKTYSCTVLIDSVEVLSGNFILNKISREGFEGFITGIKGDRLGDIIPDKKLKEIKSFTPIAFSGDTSVWEYLDQDLDATNSEICFPYVADSFFRLLDYSDYSSIYYTPALELSYEHFGVSHFTAAIFKNIFADAGYTLEGNVLTGDTFNKLTLLYSSDGSDPKYNYAALNPLASFGKIEYYQYTTANDELEDWFYYVIEPQYGDVYSSFGTLTHEKTGDQSFSLGADGVYTCKYTADYTISYDTSIGVTHTGGSSRTCKHFAAFREIGNNQNPQSAYFSSSYASLGQTHFIDSDTLITGNTVTDQTVRLQAGKQYRLQIYLCVPKDQDLTNTYIDLSNTDDNWFNITAVTGRQLLNPADFLPDLKQIDFVHALFKIFNLYYQINTFTNTVTVYTRDEFYELNKDNILDLSKNLDLSQAEETALDNSDIAATYYRYAKDESDYILKNTDYMTLVNGNIPDESYELPFSPLAFVKMDIKNSDNVTVGTDFLPAAIPDSSITDISILSDTDAISNFSYKPKLALYQSADVTNAGLYLFNRNYAVHFTRTRGLTGDTFYNFGTAVYYKYFPKLTFFNLLDQPVYEIQKNDLTREFNLVLYTGSTIYNPADSTFLNSGNTTGVVTKLNKTSIALAGAKSEFKYLYKNDLLITNYSNYFECNVKMNPVLYSKLNGRNILMIKDDLYLLESIKLYDLTGDTAKIKLYKLVSS